MWKNSKKNQTEADTDQQDTKDIVERVRIILGKE